MIKISEEPTEFDFRSLLEKEEKPKKKEEQTKIDDFKIEVLPETEFEIPLPSPETTDQYGVPVPDAIIRESKSVIPNAIREHPIVKDFTAMMDAEVEKTRLGTEIIDKIESLEKNYDLEFMQKLITIKNVLNYTQSSWSFGVCKEILDGISIRGSQKKIASGLISTIKKMAKLG